MSDVHERLFSDFAIAADWCCDHTQMSFLGHCAWAVTADISASV